MWVKRTEAEVAEQRRRQRRNRLWAAAVFGVFVMLLLTCVFGTQVGARRGRFFVPADELLSRLPFAAIAGIVMAFLFYKLERRRPMVICPKCEATKYDDGVTQCSCGGHYELMEGMKHVA